MAYPKEWMSSSNEFGDERMLESMRDSRTLTLDGSVGTLLESVQQWCSVQGPKDDISILALELASSDTPQ